MCGDVRPVTHGAQKHGWRLSPRRADGLLTYLRISTAPTTATADNRAAVPRGCRQRRDTRSRRPEVLAVETLDDTDEVVRVIRLVKVRRRSVRSTPPSGCTAKPRRPRAAAAPPPVTTVTSFVVAQSHRAARSIATTRHTFLAARRRTAARDVEPAAIAAICESTAVFYPCPSPVGQKG